MRESNGWILEEKQISHLRGKIVDQTCCKNRVFIYPRWRARRTEKSCREKLFDACPMCTNPAAEDVYGGGGRRWSDFGVVPATEK